MVTAEERAEVLASNEDIEILRSALYSALEAELSGFGWPEDSLTKLEQTFNQVNELEQIVDNATRRAN